jgi:chromosome segregation ATPase
MELKIVLEFIAQISWPIVGILGLIYLWRSEIVLNIAKELASLSKAIAEFRPLVSELSDADQKIRASTQQLLEFERKLKSIPDQISALNTAVDLILERTLSLSSSEQHINERNADPNEFLNYNKLSNIHQKMQEKWDIVTSLLEQQLTPLDKRSIGQEAFRLTDLDRPKPLTGEQADMISRLHSKIKSYNRRASTRALWLTEEVSNEFQSECDEVINLLSRVAP